jgi:hypothetical protein
MRKCTAHLGSAHSRAQPARPIGPVPLGVLTHGRWNQGGGNPPRRQRLTVQIRQAAIGRWGSGLGANPIDGDHDLGWRAARGSPELSRDSDGGRAEGCTNEGVDRLSLARLVMSVSTSKLGRCYWRGRRGRRSTGGDGRGWLVKWMKWWLVMS